MDVLIQPRSRRIRAHVQKFATSSLKPVTNCSVSGWHLASDILGWYFNELPISACKGMNSFFVVSTLSAGVRTQSLTREQVIIWTTLDIRIAISDQVVSLITKFMCLYSVVLFWTYSLGNIRVASASVYFLRCDVMWCVQVHVQVPENPGSVKLQRSEHVRKLGYSFTSVWHWRLLPWMRSWINKLFHHKNKSLWTSC